MERYTFKNVYGDNVIKSKNIQESIIRGCPMITGEPVDLLANCEDFLEKININNKDELNNYLHSIVDRAFKAGFKYCRDLEKSGSVCISVDEAIKNAKEEILK